MKHAKHQRPSFARCAREGFWFCQDCQRVVARLEDELVPAGRCAECGSHELTWHAPVFFGVREFWKN